MLARARCRLATFIPAASRSMATSRRITRPRQLPQFLLRPPPEPVPYLARLVPRSSFSSLTPTLFQENLSPPEEATDAEGGRQTPPIDPRTQEPRRGSNWNYDVELSALSHRLGHDPRELPSLRVALTHRSAISTKKPVEEGTAEQGDFQHNGRLAVLGQYLLGHYVSESLFYRYPNMEGNLLVDLEGFLSSTENLAKQAEHTGVVDLIRTRYKLKDPSKAYVSARAFRAVIGAAYTDVGPQAARKLVHDFVVAQLAGQDMHELIKLRHPKFMLSSILKSQGQPPPTSRLLRESGRLTHFPSFVVGVYSGERLLAEGCGTSLKRAEREAAMTALHSHFQTEVVQAPLPSDSEGFCEERNIDLFAEGSDSEMGKEESAN